jgi:co-chaperonin GroES (HSP10)
MKPVRPEPTVNIRPFRHRLYIQSFAPPEETKTEAGIIVTRRARENEIETGQRSLVLAVGPDCHPQFKVGDWLLVPRFSGTVVTYDSLGDADASHRVIHEDCVICWIDGDEARTELGLAKEA